jgi:hypothetical protein
VNATLLRRAAATLADCTLVPIPAAPGRVRLERGRECVVVSLPAELGELLIAWRDERENDARDVDYEGEWPVRAARRAGG